MFEIRKIKKDKWLIILLVGLLLVVIAMPVSDIKSDQTQDEQQVQKAENASEDTYTDALETRLENALAKVEGVGNVKVMITLASSSEKVVEKDQEMTSEVQEGESGGKNTSSSETAVLCKRKWRRNAICETGIKSPDRRCSRNCRWRR